MMSDSFWTALIFGAAILGWVLAGAVLLRSRAAPARRAWYVLALISMSLILLENAAVNANFQLISAPVNFLTVPLMFTVAPAFYLFIRDCVTVDGRGSLSGTAPHFIPAVLAAVNTLPVWFGLTRGLGFAWSGTHVAPLLYVNGYAIMGLHTLQIGVYAVAAWRLLRRLQTSTPANGISITPFLRINVVALAWIALLNAVGLILFLSLPRHIVELEYILLTGVALVFYGIAFASFSIPENNLAQKYRRSTLSATEAQQLVRKLEALFETEKSYMNPALTPDNLARSLQVNTHHLSQAINQELDLSFPQLLSRFRLREAERRLRNDMSDGGMLQLALECGFASKATFNRAFKRHFGVTPTEYRRQYAES
ncbi:MAG: helix-turn-helix domain-containing protein [Gammaproteobacteria bacterium]|nr:helix-turn-helix domain-containing protein [Gammaproteobacteria bacterium]